MRRLVLVILLLLFQIPLVNAQHQSRSALEKQRAALLKEIAATQDKLANTQKDKKATIGQLRALQVKLKAREELIHNINAELGNINNNIDDLKEEVERLNRNLNNLKTQYARSVRYAYKHREAQNMLAFLFSADNFNDAIRRMQYLKKYREYRTQQADRIRSTQKKLTVKIAALHAAKMKKSALLLTERQQQDKIEQESHQTNKIVVELQGREKELKTRIRKNQAAAARLQAAIKAEIKREIEIARRKAAEEAARKRAAEEAARRKAEAEALARKKAAAEEARKQAAASGNTYKSGNQTVVLNTGKPEAESKPEEAATEKPPSEAESHPSYKLSLTPEVRALSNSFAANKGKLPWPVAKGFISGTYGRHPHPVYKNVMIDNNGVDIATSPNEPVRAVFSGTVIKVAYIDGIVIMISHGEYFTVYSGLAGASVHVGDKVNTRQTIGTAGQNADGDYRINFQIWKVGDNNNSYTVNPEQWIAN